MGGLERVTTVIGKSLSNEHDVLFYSMFSHDNFYEIEDYFFVGAKKKFLNNKWLKPTRYQKAWEYFWKKEITVWRYLKEELTDLIHWINSWEIDVVIISSPVIISCIEKLKEGTSAKFVAWMHNNYHTYMDNYTRKFTSSFKKGVEKADKVICLTNPDCKEYKNLNPSTCCIYNPLTIKNNQVSSLTQKNIAFTGRLSFDHKGIDYLIEVAKKIPENWTITIAGHGSAQELRRLKKAIHLNQISNRLIFKGPLKDEQLFEHYLNSSLFLMTSRWEGMPLVLAEAMSFGLPIIAFTQSGSTEVLSDGKYGKLISSGNIESMVQAINSFVDSPNLLKVYQEKSLERLKVFNLESITNQWLTLLKELAQSSNV